jgi:hypothetical protein
MLGRGNRSTRKKTAPVPFSPPQIPHDLTRARNPGRREALYTYSRTEHKQRTFTSYKQLRKTEIKYRGILLLGYNAL